MIFDSFNLALGIFKKANCLPWKIRKPKIIDPIISEKNFDIIIDKTKEKTIDWASNMCGFIPDKEDSPFIKELALDDDYLAQIREDRMTRMLASEVNFYI